MDISQKKEQFNIAYIRAMAAQAGHNPSTPEVDDDSIDITLTAKNIGGKVRSPQIQIQLKCTSRHRCNGETLKFPLSLKNYNDLRGEDILTPRYLVVLVVPDQVDDWVKYKENNITLMGECYWTSLRNAPPTDNKTKVTIDIPASQKLTRESLVMLMEVAGDGRYI